MTKINEIYEAQKAQTRAYDAVKSAIEVVDEPHAKILQAYLKAATELMEFHYYEAATEKYSTVAILAKNSIEAVTA